MYYYVYRITNIEEGKHYYGSRKSKRHPKKDLGIYYFSSSTDKSFILLQKERPNIFKYVIVKVFNTYKEALELECKLHKRLNVGKNNKFYNKANQTSTKFSTEGIRLSKESRMKISKSSKGRKQSNDHIRKRTSKIKGKGNGMYNKNYYDIWVSLYGKEKADIMYNESLNKRIRGVNNPCYGKHGLNHPASKIYYLQGNGTSKKFNSVNEIKKECEMLGIKWNTLRQYSKKGKYVNGYIVKSIKPK